MTDSLDIYTQVHFNAMTKLRFAFQYAEEWPPVYGDTPYRSKSIRVTQLEIEFKHEVDTRESKHS
jgi:hypothetical protein